MRDITILVSGLTNNEQRNMGLDALHRVSFEDDAGKSPDFLELLVGHQSSAENGVSDSNHPVRDFKDSDAVVRQKCVPYHG